MTEPPITEDNYGRGGMLKSNRKKGLLFLHQRGGGVTTDKAEEQQVQVGEQDPYSEALTDKNLGGTSTTSPGFIHTTKTKNTTANDVCPGVVVHRCVLPPPSYDFQLLDCPSAQKKSIRIKNDRTPCNFLPTDNGGYESDTEEESESVANSELTNESSEDEDPSGDVLHPSASTVLPTAEELFGKNNDYQENLLGNPSPDTLEMTRSNIAAVQRFGFEGDESYPEVHGSPSQYYENGSKAGLFFTKIRSDSNPYDSKVDEELERAMSEDEDSEEEDRKLSPTKENAAITRKALQSLESNSSLPETPSQWKSTLYDVTNNLEFDYLSPEKLASLANVLRPHVRFGMDSRRSSVSLTLPEPTEEWFWINCVLPAALTDYDEDSASVIGSDSALQSHLSKILYECITDELSSLNVSIVDIIEHDDRDHYLYCGSSVLTESRLALSILDVSHIVLIVTYPPEELWTKDNLSANIHIVSSADDDFMIQKAIVSSCVEVQQFLEQKTGSILVAGDLEYPSAVSAAYISKKLHLNKHLAIEKMSQIRQSANAISPSWLPETEVPAYPISPNMKRIHSYRHFKEEREGSGCESPKRPRGANQGDVGLDSMPDISLGTTFTPFLSKSFSLSFRDKQKDSEDDSVDGIKNFDNSFVDELKDHSEHTGDGSGSSLVPLLTPPGSPDPAAICLEWPSNLNADMDVLSDSDRERINKDRLLDGTGLTPKINSMNVDSNFIQMPEQDEFKL